MAKEDFSTEEDLRKVISKGRIPNLLFFFGDEQYLADKRISEIKKKLVSADFADFDYAYLNGETGADEVIDAAEILPQGGERRLVVVKNSGLFSNYKSPEFEAIKEYLADLPEYVCLIFSEPKFDPKNRSLKFIKDAEGMVVKFDFLPQNKLEVWVEKMLSKEKKEIGRRELTYFVRLVGPSMARLEKECKKLLVYMGDDRRRVTMDDINRVSTKSIDDENSFIFKIFDMLMAGGRSIDEAREYITLIKNAGTKGPMQILGIFRDRLYEILICKLLKHDGLSNAEIAKYFDRRIPSFAIDKDLRFARRFRGNALKDLVEEGLKLSTDIRTGNMDIDNGWLAVDIYVSEIIRAS